MNRSTPDNTLSESERQIWDDALIDKRWDLDLDLDLDSGDLALLRRTVVSDQLRRAFRDPGGVEGIELLARVQQAGSFIDARH